MSKNCKSLELTKTRNASNFEEKCNKELMSYSGKLKMRNKTWEQLANGEKNNFLRRLPHLKLVYVKKKIVLLNKKHK